MLRQSTIWRSWTATWDELQQMLVARALQGIDLTGEEDVLDVGCGDGVITEAIAARLPRGHVLGIDRSPALVATASRRAATLANLRWEVNSPTDIAYDSDFDLVVSFNMLHWIAQQLEVLANIKAALRKEGRAVLAFVCDGERPSLEDVAMSVTTRSRWRQYFVGYKPSYFHLQPEAYLTTTATAGLDVVESSVTDLSWDFRTPDAFAAWCRAGFGAWTERLPGDQADAFVDDVLADYASVVESRQVFSFLQQRVVLRPAEGGDGERRPAGRIRR